VLRVIGFTLLHPQLLEAVPSLQQDTKLFLLAIENFLQTERQLYETQTGQLLVKAYYVRLDEKGTVEKVLNGSSM
jgi:hypothetical protein